MSHTLPEIYLKKKKKTANDNHLSLQFSLKAEEIGISRFPLCKMNDYPRSFAIIVA